MPRPAKDIYPESGSRLPPTERDSMDEEEKHIYEKLVGGDTRTLTGLRGPLGIGLHNPKLAEIESALNRYLRFNSGLSGRTRELAILATAREMDSRFEWAAHEQEAIKEGVERRIIDIIKYRRSTMRLNDTDAIIIQLSREIFNRRKVTSKTFSRALKIFGVKGLVNLIALMADYTATAVKFRVFDNTVNRSQPQLPVP